MRRLTWVISMALVLVLAATLNARLDMQETTPQRSFIDAALGATERLSTDLDAVVARMECPSDMPDCSKTARERYEKWQRGGYGWTRAVRLHWGRSIKRQILRQGFRIFTRKYPNREWHRRKQWMEYRDGMYWNGRQRICITNASFWYLGDSNPGDYCEQRWYDDPRRRFVKNVLVCAGQIALARIGLRSAPASTRRMIVGGTGALCAWDKMP